MVSKPKIADSDQHKYFNKILMIGRGSSEFKSMVVIKGLYEFNEQRVNGAVSPHENLIFNLN